MVSHCPGRIEQYALYLFDPSDRICWSTMVTFLDSAMEEGVFMLAPAEFGKQRSRNGEDGHRRCSIRSAGRKCCAPLVERPRGSCSGGGHRGGHLRELSQ